MASVNKVILIGNLGRDPEVRYTPSGTPVCTISLATTRNWTSKDSGERQEETEWHRVVLFERLAEIAGEYLKKGRAVYIEGRLRTRKWTDKDGIERYTTEIVGEQLQMLGSRPDADDEGDDTPAPTPEAKPAAAPAAKKAGGSRKRKGAPPADGTPDPSDDDIPF